MAKKKAAKSSHLKKGKTLEPTKTLTTNSSPSIFGGASGGKHIAGGKLSS
jgi:hypothetical protein